MRLEGVPKLSCHRAVLFAVGDVLGVSHGGVTHVPIASPVARNRSSRAANHLKLIFLIVEVKPLGRLLLVELQLLLDDEVLLL